MSRLVVESTIVWSSRSPRSHQLAMERFAWMAGNNFIVAVLVSGLNENQFIKSFKALGFENIMSKLLKHGMRQQNYKVIFLPGYFTLKG